MVSPRSGVLKNERRSSRPALSQKDRILGMYELGRKADWRLSGPNSEKPTIECARQMPQVFALADPRISCRSLDDAKRMCFVSRRFRGAVYRGWF
jgi:hypothetical protein